MLSHSTNYKLYEKDTVSTKEVAEILGLKYHHARLLLYNCKTIGCYNYGKVKRWVLKDVLAYKQNHYIEPRLVMGE